MPKNVRRSLTFEIGARNTTGPALASVHRGFSGLISGVSREAGVASQAISGAFVGQAQFAAAAAGAALIGFAASAAAEFARVEQSWAEVTTLMPQATRQATDQMLGEVRRFSRETGFAIQDSIQASYQALSAGIAQSELTGFLDTAGQAARAGVTDITTGVDAISSALNAYNLEAERSTDVSDAMFTAIRLGKTTFGELAPVMGPVLPIAASMNTEFQEITASVAALTAQGNPTSIAMTQIRAALVALSKDTEARSVFESVVGMSYADYQAQGGTLQEALQIIVDEAEKSGQSVVDMFGRVEGANAALALSSQKGAETFTAAMGDIEGATEDAAQKIEATTATSMQRMSAMWTDFKIGVGGFVAGLAEGMLEIVGIIERGARGATVSINQMITGVLEDLNLLPEWVVGPDGRATPPPVSAATRGNVYYVPGAGPPDAPTFGRELVNVPISQAELEVAYFQWLDAQAQQGNVDVGRTMSDPALREELFRRAEANRANLYRYGEAALRTYVPTADFSTETVPDWILREARRREEATRRGTHEFGDMGFDAPTAEDIWFSSGPAAQRAIQDWLQSLNASGGLGGAVRDNTDELRRLREAIEEETERNKLLEVAPGAAPVLPEFLQASELRYISNQVKNKLVGGVVS